MAHLLRELYYDIEYGKITYNMDDVSYSFKHKHNKIYAKKYLLKFSKQLYTFLIKLNYKRRKNPLLIIYTYKYFTYTDNTITYAGTTPCQ